jgi:hypothetical protein
LTDLLPFFSNRFLAKLTHHPNDGGSTELWNVGKPIPVYTMLQHRRQPSSYSPPWAPQIILCVRVKTVKQSL